MNQTRMKLLLPDGASPVGKNIVFISYRHRDADKAAGVIDLFLKETDFALWYDDNLSAGEKFDDEICAAINRSVAFIQVVTSSYFEPGSYTMEEEIPYAKSAGLKIAAVCVNSSEHISEQIARNKPDYVCYLYDADSVAGFFSELRSLDRDADAQEQMLRCLKKRNCAYLTPKDMFFIAQLYMQGRTDAIEHDEAIRLTGMAKLCGIDGAEDLLQQLDGAK